jgi:hypothetical protein
VSRTCLLLLLFHGGCPALLAEAKPWQEEVRPRTAGVSLGSDNTGYLHPCLTDLGATSPICKATEATHQIRRPKAFSINICKVLLIQKCTFTFWVNNVKVVERNRIEYLIHITSSALFKVSKDCKDSEEVIQIIA